MTLNEVLTLIVAAYGAGLATFLAVKEVQKEKKRIRIFLQYTNWYSVFTLKIINIGHRPITLSGVSINFKLPGEKFEKHEIIPEGLIFRFDKDGGPQFPITLEDGKQVELRFSDIVENFLNVKDTEPNIAIFDSEGNHYGGYEMLVFDGKYNFYGPLPDKWKRPRRFMGIKLPVRIFGKK